MTARCWRRRRARARFEIALRRVRRDPWLVVPLTDKVAMVGVARCSLMESLWRAHTGYSVPAMDEFRAQRNEGQSGTPQPIQSDPSGVGK